MIWYEGNVEGKIILRDTSDNNPHDQRTKVPPLLQSSLGRGRGNMSNYSNQAEGLKKRNVDVHDVSWPSRTLGQEHSLPRSEWNPREEWVHSEEAFQEKGRKKWADGCTGTTMQVWWSAVLWWPAVFFFTFSMPILDVVSHTTPRSGIYLHFSLGRFSQRHWLVTSQGSLILSLLYFYG